MMAYTYCKVTMYGLQTAPGQEVTCLKMYAKMYAKLPVLYAIPSTQELGATNQASIVCHQISKKVLHNNHTVQRKCRLTATRKIC